MRLKLTSEASVLLVIDVQSRMMDSIHSADRVSRHIEFLVKSARQLDIPIVATEQNPSRLGTTLENLAKHFENPALPKMSFSALGDQAVVSSFKELGRKQVVIVGVETHICVYQSAFDLLESGFEVVVSPDACGAQSEERHKLGMERIRDAGVVPAHSESVVFEWMHTAENPHFRAIRDLVKDTVEKDRTH